MGAPVAVLADSLDEVGQAAKPPSPAASSSVAVAPPVAASTSSSSSSSSSLSPESYEQISMPALSSTMKEGKIISWAKSVGDKVSAGDVLLVVESDKADMDVESYEDGYLAAIVVGESQSAAVGAPVGYLAKSKEDIEAVKNAITGGSISSSSSSTSSPPPSTPSTTASTSTSALTTAPAIVNEGRVAASGYAQAVAKEKGIDLRTVTPSRPDQYITSKDLSNVAVAVASSSTPAAYVPAPGVINATPMAKKLAAENKLDVTKLKGTGNFGRVTADDVLMAAGKLAPPAPKAVPAAPVAPAAPAPAAAAAAVPKSKGEPVKEVLDGVKPMDGMQKAVAKNMEKTLSVPIFRVSRYGRCLRMISLYRE